MKYAIIRLFTVVIPGVVLLLQVAGAQPVSADIPVTLAERNMGGPRLGLTYITGGESTIKAMEDKGIGRLISQFGWHFEYQVIPQGGGPSFVIQFVPLAAGVEFGTFIPSATLAMGVRFPSGLEFGIGPNLLLSPVKTSTSLVIALGKSFNYGGVSIPINIVLATNQDGDRLSLIFGYSID